MEKGVQQPKYTTIFTYPVDYSQLVQGDNLTKTTPPVPTAFNIQFAIPRVDSAEEVAGQTLEINEQQIILKIGEKYFIDLELAQFKLKFPLLTANSKAKYDRKKKTLRISIPVDPSYKPPVPENPTPLV